VLSRRRGSRAESATVGGRGTSGAVSSVMLWWVDVYFFMKMFLLGDVVGDHCSFGFWRFLFFSCVGLN